MVAIGRGDGYMSTGTLTAQAEKDMLLLNAAIYLLTYKKRTIING